MWKGRPRTDLASPPPCAHQKPWPLTDVLLGGDSLEPWSPPVTGYAFEMSGPSKSLLGGCLQNPESFGFRKSRTVRLLVQPQRLLEQHPVRKYIGVSAAKRVHIPATWGECGLEILSVQVKSCHHMVPNLGRKLDFLSFLDFRISGKGCGHVS